LQRTDGPFVNIVKSTSSAARCGRRDKGSVMKSFDAKSLDEMQQAGKESVDVAMKSFGSASKGAQAIAAEMADYSKKAFEDGAAVFEKLLAARSVEKVIEVQQSYLKDAYEGFVSKATKIGELYADLAKEAYKPYEGLLGKTGVK
jgi:hypothetical protein